MPPHTDHVYSIFGFGLGVDESEDSGEKGCEGDNKSQQVAAAQMDSLDHGHAFMCSSNILKAIYEVLRA
jgi:hypothetical protein